MKTYKQISLGALFLGALFLTIGLAGSGVAAPGQTPAPNDSQPAGDKAEEKSGIAAAYGQLPLAFEPNQGQSDPRVKFLCRGAGYSLFLTETESVLGLRAPNTHRGFQGIEPLPGRSNYFIGNDPKKWRTNIPQYARVTSAQVYPGIDLVYYGRQHRLEYDFQVAPGADPGAIRFSVEGARKIDLDAQGNLLLHAPGGDVIEQAPVIYQEIGGKRTAVAGSFELHPIATGEAELTKSEISVGFRVASYDRSKPLIIDPPLVYSTYLGGSGNSEGGDEGNGIAVDGSGHAYVTGYAYSTN